MHHPAASPLRASHLAFLLGLLAACGGGGAGDDAPPPPPGPDASPGVDAAPPPAPPPPPAEMDAGGPPDTGPTPPPGLDPRLEPMLAAHNAVRASASPAPSPALPPMTWAEDLAAAAQAYAERCEFEHDSGRGPVGENLSVNAPPGWQTGEDVVFGWAEESEDYDYASGRCSRVCGHYTQIVWRESVELGCGVATCDGVRGFTSNAGELWVCRYRAPGNFGGRQPY